MVHREDPRTDLNPNPSSATYKTFLWVNLKQVTSATGTDQDWGCTCESKVYQNRKELRGKCLHQDAVTDWVPKCPQGRSREQG